VICVVYSLVAVSNGSKVDQRSNSASPGKPRPGQLERRPPFWIHTRTDRSENNRRAKYYLLTRAGKRRVEKATREWKQTTEIVARCLAPEARS
jgi:hypothetical protein